MKYLDTRLVFCAICTFIWLSAISVNAGYNVTVEESDFYSLRFQPVSCASGRPGWYIEHNPGFSAGSSHYCNESGSSVTFVFHGTGVYFLSPRWPYPIGMNVSLDGQPSQYLNVTDPDAPTNFESNMTVASRPVWSAIDLRDTQHTLVLSRPTSTNGSFDIHIDGFIYVVETFPPTTARPPALPTPARAPPSTSTYPSRPDPTSDPGGSAAQKKAVIAGATIGLVILAFIALMIWIVIRSRMEKKAVSAARCPPHSRTSTPSRDSKLGRTSTLSRNSKLGRTSTPSRNSKLGSTSTPSRNSKLGSDQSCNTPVILRSILMNPSPRSTTVTPPSNPESHEPEGPVPSTPASLDATLDPSCTVPILGLDGLARQHEREIADDHRPCIDMEGRPDSILESSRPTSVADNPSPRDRSPMISDSGIDHDCPL